MSKLVKDKEDMYMTKRIELGGYYCTYQLKECDTLSKALWHGKRLSNGEDFAVVETAQGTYIGYTYDEASVKVFFEWLGEKGTVKAIWHTVYDRNGNMRAHTSYYA